MSKKIRHDACYAALSAEVKLRILKESEEGADQETHRKSLAKVFGRVLPNATYYRMLGRFRESKPDLIAEVEAGKASSGKVTASAGTPALTEIRAKLGDMSKRLDKISREQSFLAAQLQAIGAGRKDAFVMYMNMRNLNRVIRNSAFIADALELTRDIPYPGRRNVPIDSIFAFLEKLDRSTEKRIDAFLRNGFSKAFDRGDLTDKELYMLRLRFIWGCSLVNKLERDSQIPLSGAEEEMGFVFEHEVSPACLFVDLWKDMREGWLYDASAQIYHFGKFPSPYENTVAQAKRIMFYSQKREQKPT